MRTVADAIVGNAPAHKLIAYDSLLVISEMPHKVLPAKIRGRKGEKVLCNTEMLDIPPKVPLWADSLPPVVWIQADEIEVLVSRLFCSVEGLVSVDLFDLALSTRQPVLINKSCLHQLYPWNRGVTYIPQCWWRRLVLLKE
jgi:hypothetical protein